MWKSKIKSYYETHSKARICQGDILRDFKFNIVDKNNKVKETSLMYLIILSQDCDLERGYESKEKVECNQYLPNILFLPAFLLTDLKNGAHLEDLYDIKQRTIGSNEISKIKENKIERYHFLATYSNLQVPELIIDFKLYFTLPKECLLKNYNDCYLATVNELFREQLSQRFAYYLSRIGVPLLTSSKPTTLQLANP